MVEDKEHCVVAVAVPVVAGTGGTLHEMVIVPGHVMDTCPERGAVEAKASIAKAMNHVNLLFREEPWGLAPG